MNTLNKLSITEAVNGLIQGDFSIVEITKDCIEQIQKYDNKYKVFITLLEESALKEAEEKQKILKKEGKKIFEKMPLFGIPYTVKDNFSTKGIRTTSGSNVLNNYIPPYESTVTQKLKDAGAILLGKVNLDAYAHGSSTENSDFFTTLNPWDISRVPGGSSGGSAASVILDMCIFSIGSETGGSIRGPAAWCGVTGLKPSYGRVSRYGVTAMASSTDCPGPITKNVLDSATILKVIAGKDPYDATTSFEKVEDYTFMIEKFDMSGIKIGLPKSFFSPELDEGVLKVVKKEINKFKDMGAQIIEIDLLDPKYSIAVYTILQRSEVSSNLGRLDGIRYGNPRSEFGFEAKKRIMLGTYTLGSGYYDAYYSKAQKVRTLIVEDFKKAFNKVDIIIGPTMPCVAPKVGANDTSPMFGELIDVLTEPAAISGIPGISIPCGFSENLPVGLQLMGNINKESDILGAAHLYQKVTNFHKERPKK